MTTGAYMADTPDLLTRTLTHLVEARLVMPDGEALPLDVQDARTTFDDTRATHPGNRVGGEW